MLVLLSGLFASPELRLLRRLAGGLAVVSLVADRLWTRTESENLMVLSLATALLFVGLTALGLLAEVFRPGPVTGHRIRGAIAVYLLMGLLWALAYGIAGVLSGGQALDFSSVALEALSHRDRLPHQVYFSFVTLTTLGYGDIVPVSSAARALVISEALAGQLYLATLVARLVSSRGVTSAAQLGTSPGAEERKSPSGVAESP